MSQLDLIGDGMTMYTGETDELERYFTPAPIVDALVSRQARDDKWRPQLVLEPCAGRQLSIVRVLESWAPAVDYRVVTADLDPGAPVQHHGDFREIDWGAVLQEAGAARFDQVITNPPFSQAAELLRVLAPYTRKAVTMLVRISFAEPCVAREDVLKPFVVVDAATGEARTWQLWRRLTTPRQQFRQGEGSGTDSATTEWMTWRPRTILQQPAPHDVITRQEGEDWRLARAAGRIGQIGGRG